MSLAPPPAAPPRIASMDQFRGYTVFGMFLVNFLGGMAAIHSVFKHNNTYCSYADTIMPSFMFACGFSFRLTVLRRIEADGPRLAYTRAARRCLSLVLVSLVLFGAEDLDAFKGWADMTWPNIHDFFAKMLKAQLWEVLAIIGCAQLLILPVVARKARVRFATLVGFLILHAVLTHYFNYWFVRGRPSALDGLWGVSGTSAWDGGFFGLLMWAVPMLAGTLVYDLVSSKSAGASAGLLIPVGVLVMLLGYGASCLTRAYDITPASAAALGDDKFAPSPVVPDLSLLKGRPWKDLLADPPFVEPPGPEVRKINYWMMDKRITTISFITFATGFSLALYGLFVVACDILGARLGIFRMLGMNPLLAYVIHHAVEALLHLVTPKDSPLWWCLVSLVLFYALTLAFVKFFDDRKIFVRL